MTRETSARDPVEVIVGFTRRLGEQGVRVPPTRVHSMIDALDELGAHSTRAVYWSGRVTLCASPEDIERYDHAFADYFSGGTAVRRPEERGQPARRPIAVPADPATADGAYVDENPPAPVATASRIELLRHRDVADLSAAERDEVHRYISALMPAGPRRVSRRWRASHAGGVDPRRTIQAMLRHGGEPAELRRRRRAHRYRRLVFLVDVSGSMAPYADTLLRFAHAACRSRPGTEVFTIGTRLTRVTRELRSREPRSALAAASAVIDDWSGGTRLGDEVGEFLDTWGRRGTARGAIVVIGSDGWERGDPAPLGEQMARLARLAHRVVWVNPHRGRAGFAPRTGGMRAVLPIVDDLVAGHSLAAMDDLAALLSAARSEGDGGGHA